MKFPKLISSSKGLTLIEVLVSLMILSIILLGVMNFFNQAYSYTNLNQKKTAAVNVARNALTFVEQSSFMEIKDMLEKDSSAKGRLLVCDNSYMIQWTNNTNLANCHPITINNIDYGVEIDPNSDENYTSFFIPISVKVTWEVNNHTYDTTVEGAVKSEDLR
ncbi:type IV pilus modification PilV family protein [Niallia sp. 03133]|uniref:type IV pilus modification PilV family protein n=1 Tax=Niallia sp. 03133 TaxID=3458060 RepID=UPI004043B782